MVLLSGKLQLSGCITIATVRLHDGRRFMDHTVERELTVPQEVEEVWRSLAQPEWLGDDASIELREAGDVRAGERDGFVEEAEAPRRLVFWWSAPGEDSTRVEIDLDETENGTRVRVTESRPLEILDGRDLAVEFSGRTNGGGAEPMALAGGALAGALR
jgi:uncharacterized protein YndB with AHSA1/START domain